MFTFKVKPDNDAEFEITATSRDVVLWERIGKNNSLQNLNDNLRMTDMYSLAHVSAKRQQLTSMTLQEFTESCDIEPQDADEAETDPTPPGH